MLGFWFWFPCELYAPFSARRRLNRPSILRYPIPNAIIESVPGPPSDVPLVVDVQLVLQFSMALQNWLNACMSGHAMATFLNTGLATYGKNILSHTSLVRENLSHVVGITIVGSSISMGLWIPGGVKLPQRM